MDDVRLTCDDVVATVAPALGGRLSGLSVGGRHLLIPGERRGSFPMAPWCGRTAHGLLHLPDGDVQLPRNSGDHAIHGTVRDRAWDVLTATATTVTLACDLTAPWPFPGRVVQELTLAPSHLDLTMTVTTAGPPFPAQAGWHPWFAKTLADGDASPESGGDAAPESGGDSAPESGGDTPAHLEFAAAWQEERGDMIPTGRRIPVGPQPWDDCFGMPDGVSVAVVWPGRLRLDITSPAQWVVIFDERPEAVCVEPQSGPPNGLNTAPRIVTVDDPLVMHSRWTWTRLG